MAVGPTFSAFSYGFRPGRSAHQAVAQAQAYIEQGYSYVVDIDLEKFFDRVCHDRLMSRLAQRITDKRAQADPSLSARGHFRRRTDDEAYRRYAPGRSLSPFLSNVIGRTG